MDSGIVLESALWNKASAVTEYGIGAYKISSRRPKYWLWDYLDSMPYSK